MNEFEDFVIGTPELEPFRRGRYDKLIDAVEKLTPYGGPERKVIKYSGKSESFAKSIYATLVGNPNLRMIGVQNSKAENGWEVYVSTRKEGFGVDSFKIEVGVRFASQKQDRDI